MRFILDSKLDKYFSPGYNLNKYSSNRINNRSSDKLLIYNNYYISTIIPIEIEIATTIIPIKRKYTVSVDNPQSNNNSNNKYKGDAT